MTADEFLELYNDCDGEFDGNSENVILLEQSEWKIDYKDYASRSTIYKKDTQWFAIYESRSGSYYSDYYYDEPTCEEVIPQEVTTITYVTKST